MAITIEIPLKPVVANLRRLDFNMFLLSTELDNVMLENNFDDIWSVAIRQYSLNGQVAKRDAHENAFIEICNLFWKKDKDTFFKFIWLTIAGFITSRSYKDFSSLLTSLQTLGMKEEELDKLKKLIADKKVKTVAKLPDQGSHNKKPLLFIGHGISPLWREVDVFLREENISFVDFESDSRTGEHVIDVLKDFLATATFAIIVVTAEDQTDEGKVRARQNVIHEIGLFQGKLGFENVAILKQNGVEGFSNNDGLQHIPFDSSNIKNTFYELSRTLKKAGLKK